MKMMGNVHRQVKSAGGGGAVGGSHEGRWIEGTAFRRPLEECTRVGIC